MRIEPRSLPARIAHKAMEFALVVILAGIWVLSFFGLLYLVAMAAVYW